MDGKKFKVGDRVRVTKTGADAAEVELGDVGVIFDEGASSTSHYIRFDSGNWTIKEQYLELVDEQSAAENKFKVGDRVRVTNPFEAVNDDGVELPLTGGELGTVTDNDNSNVSSVRLDEYPDHEWWFSNAYLELVTETPAGTDLGSYETVALEDLVDVLNPDDPFERVIMDMVATNRRKRADYAVDGSPWSNFDDTANALGIDGFTPVDSVNFNIEQKSARLRSLRKNGRMQDPRNESVTDTYLDRAVYAVIALAMHTYPTGKVEPTEEDAA